MNYLIEENIDFYKILNDNFKLNNEIISDTDSSNCLISNKKLEDNYITFDCEHKFNYEIIYKEICNQKKHNHLEITKLKDYQIKCPYCRVITNNLLPYFSKYNLALVYGVKLSREIYKKIKFLSIHF